MMPLRMLSRWRILWTSLPLIRLPYNALQAYHAKAFISRASVTAIPSASLFLSVTTTRYTRRAGATLIFREINIFGLDTFLNDATLEIYGRLSIMPRYAELTIMALYSIGAAELSLAIYSLAARSRIHLSLRWISLSYAAITIGICILILQQPNSLDSSLLFTGRI